jgi:hypothetical protein
MPRRQPSRKSPARSNYPRSERLAHSAGALPASAIGFYWLWETMMAGEIRLHLTISTAFAVTTALVAFCGAVSAQTQLETRIAAGVGKIRAACGDDIKKYCSTVTPGDSRLMLCIQAHEDQISVQCDYALFESSRNLERALDRIGQIADVCWTDIEQFCSHLPAGW